MGGIIGGPKSPPESKTDAVDTSKPLIAFSPSEFRLFKIRTVKDLSPNTRAFIVDLQSPQHVTNLFASSHLLIKGPTGPDGKFQVRPYTPTSISDDKGYFELVIKMYPGGAVSEYLYNLKVGNSVEVKGPMSSNKYVCNSKKEIGMLAGGSGITPMVQIIKTIVRNPEDTTQISLVYANSTEEDILLREELDDMTKRYPNFKVHYVVSKPKTKWSGYQGRINPAIISATMPTPDSSHLIYVSGPPSFMESISGTKTPDKKQGSVEGFLKEAGYTEEMVWKF